MIIFTANCSYHILNKFEHFKIKILAKVSKDRALRQIQPKIYAKPQSIRVQPPESIAKLISTENPSTASDLTTPFLIVI